MVGQSALRLVGLGKMVDQSSVGRKLRWGAPLVAALRRSLLMDGLDIGHESGTSTPDFLSNVRTERDGGFPSRRSPRRCCRSGDRPGMSNWGGRSGPRQGLLDVEGVVAFDHPAAPKR